MTAAKRGITNTQFATIVGVNEGNVRKAIKSGRIVLSPDGLIDPDTQVVRWHRTSSRRPPDEPKERPPKPEKPKSDNKGGRPKKSGAYEESASAGERWDKEKEKKFEKVSLQVDILREDLAASRRDSINRSEARRALTLYMRVNRDAWINFVNRYGGEIAAELSVDAKTLMAVLEQYIRKQLEENSKAPPPKEL